MGAERIAEIRKSWQVSHVNIQASIDMWDSMAPTFAAHADARFEDNSFLQLLMSEGMVTPSAVALDVGCGTGKYAFALAPLVAEVTGVDLSGAMVDLARKRKQDAGASNVAFFQANWHELDLVARGWKRRFDLVLAHMTPAVQSAATFEKLEEASKGWCVYTRAIKRTDSVSDRIKEMLGIGGGTESADGEVLAAFELLWLQGRLPRIHYEPRRWQSRRDLPSSLDVYLNRMRSYRFLTDAEEAQVTDYVKSLVQGGVVVEDIDSTIVTLYWHVDNQ